MRSAGGLKPKNGKYELDSARSTYPGAGVIQIRRRSIRS